MTLNAIEYLQIEPTTRCNYTCGFCAGRHMTQSDLRFDVFERLVADTPHLKHIELQGEGEPFLHPRFFDMARLAKARGIDVSVITNGSHFSDEAIDAILDIGFEKITVSMESADEETFRAIRGGKLQKVVDGLSRLLMQRNERGLDRPLVGLAVMVMRRTRGDLVDISRLYRRLGMDGGALVQPLQRMECYTRHYDPVLTGEILSRDELRAWFEEAATVEALRTIRSGQRKASGFYGGLLRDSAGSCGWLERGLYVDRDGVATGCCAIKDTPRYALGDVTKDPLFAILERRRSMRDELRSGTTPLACRGCSIAARAIAQNQGHRQPAPRRCAIPESMLPSKIVGSVVTSSGSQPFVLDTPTGKVVVGDFSEADGDQRLLGSSEKGAVKKQVESEVAGVREVRVGSYRCPKCDRWVDVVASPKDWSGDRCARC